MLTLCNRVLQILILKVLKAESQFSLSDWLVTLLKAALYMQ